MFWQKATVKKTKAIALAIFVCAITVVLQSCGEAEGRDTRLEVRDSYLDIPAEALPKGTQISAFHWGWWGKTTGIKASALSDREYKSRKRSKEILQENYGMDYGVGGFYQFVPDTLELSVPATFTFAYPDSDVVDIDEGMLQMYHWEDSVMNWVHIGGTVNTDSNIVRADIVKFGAYTLAPTMPADQINLNPDSDTVPSPLRVK